MTISVLVAGATGDLGHRIVREILGLGARVRVLTRGGAAADRLSADDRVEVVSASYDDHPALVSAVRGVDVVVSALSGTRTVIVDAQRALLDAAVEAGVPRFVPSDYSADYRGVTPGTNRNFELRREFAADLDAAPIRATSVLNGAFADMLTGQAPLVLFGRRRVLAWSSADQVLDPDAPRFVEVAGDRVTSRSLADTMSRLTGVRHRVLWAGTTGSLSAMATLGRRLSRDDDEPFPAWQGMQYFVTMFSGEGELRNLGGERYRPERWTSVEDVLAEHLGV
ncbi:MAG: NmrA family NAD(P)-binding protein [Curtobacterium sp.]